MASIFNCWACDKSLLGKPERKGDDEYFFWCDKKCHDKYEKKISDSGRVMRAWSKFMCAEGPCPKEMREEARKQGILGPDNHLLTGGGQMPAEDDDEPKKAPRVKGQRLCGKCGEPGHNARTCGRQKKAPAPKKGKPKKKRGPKKVSKRKAPSRKRGAPKVTTKRRGNKRKASKRRRYQCSKCGGFGHNARTCNKG